MTLWEEQRPVASTHSARRSRALPSLKICTSSTSMTSSDRISRQSAASFSAWPWPPPALSSTWAQKPSRARIISASERCMWGSLRALRSSSLSFPPPSPSCSMLCEARCFSAAKSSIWCSRVAARTAQPACGRLQDSRSSLRVPERLRHPNKVTRGHATKLQLEALRCTVCGAM